MLDLYENFHTGRKMLWHYRCKASAFYDLLLIMNVILSFGTFFSTHPVEIILRVEHREPEIPHRGKISHVTFKQIRNNAIVGFLRRRMEPKMPFPRTAQIVNSFAYKRVRRTTSTVLPKKRPNSGIVETNHKLS